MKTFEDLEFKKQCLPFIGTKEHASLNFNNGYGVSVILGKSFYSNGVDTYEMAILKDGYICYTTDITDDVLGYITKNEITEYMIKIQQL